MDQISFSSLEQGEEPVAAVSVEVVQLEQDLMVIDAGVTELESFDVRPVAVLVDAIENPEVPQEMPSPAAQAMADDWIRLNKEVAVLEERVEIDGHGPGSALRRLDVARAEATAAEAGLERTPLSSEDEAALQVAHDRVLEAEQKASGLRSRSGQRKLAAAMEEQQRILDRVGFPTWSAYVMGASLMGVEEGGASPPRGGRDRGGGGRGPLG